MTSSAPNQRKRVLFVTPWYPLPDSPAAGVFVREHARAAALYDDVAVVHLVQGGPEPRGLVELEWVSGEPFFVIRVRRRAIRYAGWLLELFALVKAARKLRARGFIPDILHAHVAPNAAPAALYSRLKDLPMVLTEHWSIYLDADPHLLRGATALLSRVALKRAAKVLPVGSALEAAMRRFAPNACYELVPNVIDCELFKPPTIRPPTETIELIAIGLLSPEKNYPVMIDAVGQLVDAGTPVRLEIVGYGDGQRQLEQLIEQRRLQNNVQLIGYLPQPEVAERLRRSHVFVHASRFETFCVGAAEALASGIPAVSTRCGGPEDYLTPETGRLVPGGDPQALAAGIRAVIEHVDSFEPDRIAEHARARFAPEVIGRRLHNLYATVSAALPQQNPFDDPA